MTQEDPVRSPAERVSTRPADPGVGHPARSARITSLDVARGFFLLVAIVCASVIPPVPWWLQHAPWSGVTFVDLLFPLFVSLSGVGMAFLYRRNATWQRTARRVIVLLLAGVAYSAVINLHFELSTLRLTGVLQLYAVLILAFALLHQVTRSARGWAVITLVAAVVATLAYLWFQSRCVGDLLTPRCNPSLAIDGRIFGAHMYHQGLRGHDPEGLVAIGGAFITAAAGTTAGHLALDARTGSRQAALTQIAVWTVTCAALGSGVALLVEPFKRLWTPSFALMAGALGLALFLAAFAVFDVYLERTLGQSTQARIGWPLVALGRNSLLVYFGFHLVAAFLLRGGDEISYAERIGDALSFLGGERVAFALAHLALWWVVAALLHHRRIYIRA